ncbi:MAG: SHOCT domain-containing protein [Oscillospiraceae bacterium]|nr:SHOCT domain-containing protein [Oscillospiraceae bacterium]
MFKSKEEKQAKKLAKQQAKQAEKEENLRKANEYSERRLAEIMAESAARQAKIDVGDTAVQRFFDKAGDKVAGAVEKVGTGAAQKIIDFGNDGLDRVYGNFETHLKNNYPHYYQEVSQIEDINEKRKRMDEIDKIINNRNKPHQTVQMQSASQTLPSQNSRLDDLSKLRELLDSGALTQEEFEAEKSKILNS